MLKHGVVFFIWLGGKRIAKSPDGKQSVTLIDTHNTERVTSGFQWGGITFVPKHGALSKYLNLKHEQ